MSARTTRASARRLALARYQLMQVIRGVDDNPRPFLVVQADVEAAVDAFAREAGRDGWLRAAAAYKVARERAAADWAAQRRDPPGPVLE